ncbi:unnamed protein product [Lactuca virosa]|uniref:Uncharacterized protein n=1 Tax=Lactuca virosa TaxID=75947 RepID=A0AAU9MG09_9ASTR|nr:unnamed protein product [Lactuca virosa]
MIGVFLLFTEFEFAKSMMDLNMVDIGHLEDSDTPTIYLTKTSSVEKFYKKGLETCINDLFFMTKGYEGHNCKRQVTKASSSTDFGHLSSLRHHHLLTGIPPPTPSPATTSAGTGR